MTSSTDPFDAVPAHPMCACSLRVLSEELAVFFEREIKLRFEERFEEQERLGVFRGDLLIGTRPRQRRPCAEGSLERGRLLVFP